MSHNEVNGHREDNDTYDPKQEKPAAVTKSPPQLDLVKCRCRCCGCACASSRGHVEQRLAIDSGVEDACGTVNSVVSSYEDSINMCDDGHDDSIAGQEGVERYEETLLARPFIECLLERLEVAELQRRSSLGMQWPTPPSPIVPGTETPFSMMVGLPSEQHSGLSSLNASTFLGHAGQEVLFTLMDSRLEDAGLFVAEPLRLGIEPEFCQNMRIGDEMHEGFVCDVF